MSKLLFSILTVSALSFADTVYIDNSMAAAEHSDTEEYEERVSVGPYVEFTNIKMSNVTYNYKVNNRKYDINIDNTYTYGAAGNLPFNNYIGFYMIAAYQYLGISYQDRNLDGAYKALAQMEEDYMGWDVPLDSGDIKGRHQMHTVLFQIGFDLGLPLYSSYDYQFMIKLFGFGGGIAGKTFFQDDSKFVAPPLYGYAYGFGLRMAFHKAVLSGGVRNSHEYFHAYFERKISETKDGDEFMLDFDNYFQPFVNLSIALF
ncbi:hypothetical protein [Fibrobacter sp.]|uniref:hypothetical protein n=1 Tax=Fibrobacter sp. TaxID=35828 RepID=UPI00388EDBB4